MKDIDFDELDRAVSTLMADMQPTGDTNSQPVSATSQEAKPPAETADTPNPDDTARIPTADVTPSVSAPAVTNDVSVQRSSRGPSLAARRSGRFMDVVPPASTRVAPAPAPSRVGVSVAPTSSSPVLDVAAPRVTQQDTAAASPVTATSSDMAMPDPLDVMQSRAEPTVESDGPTDINSDTAADTEAMSDAAASPLVSPFLPDAKVDKRPLGSAQSSNEAPQIESAPVQPDTGFIEAVRVNSAAAVTVPKEDRVPDMGASEAQMLPVELREDILAIESGAATPIDDEPATATPAIASTSPVQQPASEPVSPGVAIGSIPQQYKEVPQKSGDNEEHVPMYDASSPTATQLEHPAKKKSGWLVVMWIVVLIALAIGGAVGLYYLGVI